MSADLWISTIIGIGFLFSAIYVGVARRRQQTWVIGFVLLFFCAELNFAHALQGFISDFEARVFWHKMVYAGFAVTPTAFFILSLRYAGFGKWLNPGTRLLLSAFPALSITVVFTNEMHGLVWNPAITAQVVNTVGYMFPSDARIWYWLFLAYSYSMMVLGLVLIAWSFIRSGKVYRWLVSSTVIAAILAMLGTAIDIFKLSPLPSFTATTLGFAIGTLTVVLTLSTIRRRDLTSVSYKTIINNIQDSIIVVDMSNLIVNLNPAAEKLLGMSASQAIGKPVDQLMPELVLFRDNISAYSQEVSLVLGQTLRIFDLSISTIADWRKQTLCKVAIFHDITARKYAEENLRQAIHATQAIFWRAIVTKSNVGTSPENPFIWNINYFSPDNVPGGPPLSAMSSSNFSDLFRSSVLAEDRSAMDLTSANAMHSGADGYAQDFRLQDENGAIHWMHENARIKKLSESQFEILGFITDITDRKGTEEALRESQARLSAFFEFEPAGILILNKKTRLIHDVNNSALQMIGLPRQAVLGKVCHGFLCSAAGESCPLCDSGQAVPPSEQILISAGGTKIPILKTVVPIKIKNEDYLLASFIDISDQKKAEEKILASIEEKEALLKEIHHRVKNNLQIISSLLNLQARQFNDQKMIEAFRESQNRVRSMALIHEKLYRSANFAHIRFDEYLKELTRFLVRTYNDSARYIQLEIQADPVTLDIDSAISCGLIVNELITNSIKHGFPALQNMPAPAECRIWVGLVELPGHQIKLTIADNGIGFPQGRDFLATGSLGLQLVTSLTQQLGGDVAFTTNNGSQTEITFTSQSSISHE